MLPVPTVTPVTVHDVTVEFFIQKLEKHRKTLPKWSYTPDGTLIIEEPVVERDPPAPIAFSNDEYDFLLHCLEEKKMSNWMINGLETEVSQLKMDVDREKQLHLETLLHLKTPSTVTLIDEQCRLRAALRDSRYEQLRIENEFLKSQISQFTADLFKAQTNIQALRSPLDHHSEALRKLQEQLKEKDLKLIELEAISSGNERVISELGSLQDNYNIQEFELERVKEELARKEQNVLDLEEHLRNLLDDAQVDESYQNFMEENAQIENEEKLRALEENHAIELKKLELELQKWKNPPQTHQPDHQNSIYKANLQKLIDESSRIRERLAILQMKHDYSIGENLSRIEELERLLRIKNEENQELLKVMKMERMDLKIQMIGEAVKKFESERPSAPQEASYFASFLPVGPKSETNGLEDYTFGQNVLGQEDMAYFVDDLVLRNHVAQNRIEELEKEIAKLSLSELPVVAQNKEIELKEREIQKLQKTNLEFSGEISKLLVSINEREQMIANLVKSDSATSLKSSMLIAQLKFDLAKVNDELEEKRREIRVLEDKLREESESEDSDGWGSIHGSDVEELE